MFKWFSGIFKRIRSSQTNAEDLQARNLLKYAYHECGHLVFALLFDSYFSIEKITLQAKSFKDRDFSCDEGFLHIKSKPREIEVLPDFKNKFIILAFAGVCAQNLFFLKKEELEEYIPKFINNPDEYMDISGNSGDMELIGKNAQLVLLEYEMSYEDYRKVVFGFIFLILSQDLVWESVLAISSRLISAPGQTLNFNEIQEVASHTGLIKFFAENQQKISDEYQKRFILSD